MTFCLPAPSVITTGASVVELLKEASVASLMTVPYLLEEICLLPDDRGVLALKNLRFVAFGGAPLKSTIGEKLAAADVKLLNHYGSAEIGSLAPIFIPKSDYDWRYFRLRKDMNVRLEPAVVSGDEVKYYKLFVRPFGWKTTFEVQDQLVSSPYKPTTDFKPVGRNDDLLVLATGEKVWPHILEERLSANELVKVAIAFGDGRFELGVIVQPIMSLLPDEYENFKMLVWPVILEANSQMDTHARISSKDAIIITPTETVVPRTDKGTVRRKEVFKLFEKEISGAYEKLENSNTDDFPVLRLESLEQDIRDLMQARLNWNIPAGKWTIDDDFFEVGMNSLQAVHLRRFLLSSIKHSTDLLHAADRIGRDFVYQYPSIASIARALRAMEDSSTVNRQSSIENFVASYSLEQRNDQTRPAEGLVVLLTGGTGSLGVHLLAQLASLPTVARVVCLNRVTPYASSLQDPYQRQYRSAQEKGVEISQQMRSKIQIFESNSALPCLGLSNDDYSYLRGSVTHVVHNAWPMDFRRKLRSFEAQFQILQNLLGLFVDVHTTRPIYQPKILLVSSISVVGMYGLVHGGRIVPETPIGDTSCTNRTGYAEAKLICEMILEKAVRQYRGRIEGTCVRIGQMVGCQSSGYWNTEEHLPALIKSSQKLGRLPRLNGVSSCIVFPDADLDLTV